jgi:hypothetical protein
MGNKTVQARVGSAAMNGNIPTEHGLVYLPSSIRLICERSQSRLRERSADRAIVLSGVTSTPVPWRSGSKSVVDGGSFDAHVSL